MSKKLDAEIQRRLAVELAHLMRAIINENPTYVLECYEALGKMTARKRPKERNGETTYEF